MGADPGISAWLVRATLCLVPVHVGVERVEDSGDIAVTMHRPWQRQVLQSTPGSQIYVHSSAGDDSVVLSSRVVHDAMIFAGKGNDRVVGGRGADQIYGGRGYTCLDLEGHLWSFGSYDPWSDEG